MENTDKQVCRDLAILLVEHGVKHVFLSPGSRNAPLIVAIARCPELQTTVVVDERCAAFMAMGYALISGEPVAVVCTSGTALLNYAPAVAEAFYRRLSLIVISADRPAEWIDQDDSQTLRQPGALANYVKLSCDIPEITTGNLAWYANRQINDALIAATTGRPAPVHINIQLDAPLGRITDNEDPAPRAINVVIPEPVLSPDTLGELWGCIQNRRVMIIAGFYPPNQELSRAISALATLPNVAILTETIANLNGNTPIDATRSQSTPDYKPDGRGEDAPPPSTGLTPDHTYISRIDTTLSAMDEHDREAMVPDIVITFGGALVSRFVKEYMRRCHPREHWHVGVTHTTTDCFQSLTRRIEIAPEHFFPQLVECMRSSLYTSDYGARWRLLYREAIATHDAYIAQAPWSDLKAFDILAGLIPKDWNVQWSNGTPIRYAQLIGDIGVHRQDCNRGVSGIDGCTSTAVGAAMAYSGTTLLITGDMSAHYDIGALANVRLAQHLKVIVMCNGGGSIFRFISATNALPELDEYLAVAPQLPLPDLCRGYGIAYHEAADADSLRTAFAAFASQPTPALLAIHTPAQVSAEVLKGYFLRK